MKYVLKTSIPVFLVLFSKCVLEIKHRTRASEAVGKAFTSWSGLSLRVLLAHLPNSSWDAS